VIRPFVVSENKNPKCSGIITAAQFENLGELVKKAQFENLGELVKNTIFVA